MTHTQPAYLSAEVISYVRGRRAILTNAYVDAVPGQVTALIGASGSGKTTLMQIMVGRRRCEEAHVRWKDAFVPQPRFASLGPRGLFYLPDTRWLSPSLSVAQHLLLASRLGDADWRMVSAEYGLEELLASNTVTLSGGESRLLGLVMALLAHPRVVVADEPWRGLDPKTRVVVGMMLRRMADAGCAVLAADHDVTAILAIADRVFSMEEGRTRLIPDFKDQPVSSWYRQWGG